MQPRVKILVLARTPEKLVLLVLSLLRLRVVDAYVFDLYYHLR